MIITALAMVLCHYSSLVYHLVTEGTAIGFLQSNPNLILPIYPCNVVMWCCVIFAFSKFGTRLSGFLADYIFLFGLASALFGMFVNIDFLNNPTLLNYDVTKGILAHAIMLFNVLLIPALGFYKLDLPKNLLHIVISVIMMYVVGLYCNLVFRIVASEAMAYIVNSMFILHSPFDGLPFVKYPVIAGAAILLYLLILIAFEQILHKKGDRWYNRLKK